MLTILRRFDNKIEAKEAMAVLNCSLESLMRLIEEKKLAAQKINHCWYLSPTECYQYKERELKAKKAKRNLKVINKDLNFKLNTFSTPSLVYDIETELKIQVPTVQRDSIKSALKFSGKKCLYQTLNQKIDQTYEKLKFSIS